MLQRFPRLASLSLKLNDDAGAVLTALADSPHRTSLTRVHAYAPCPLSLVCRFPRLQDTNSIDFIDSILEEGTRVTLPMLTSLTALLTDTASIRSMCTLLPSLTALHTLRLFVLTEGLDFEEFAGLLESVLPRLACLNLAPMRPKRRAYATDEAIAVWEQVKALVRRYPWCGTVVSD